MFHLSRIKLLILTFLFCFPTISYALPSPTDEFFVNDYADLIIPETEEYIIEKSKSLENVDGTQIVVVTVNNLEDYGSIEEYSIDLARKFGIGSSTKDNGVLILIAKEERELRIEIGTGLEGILPDGKVGRIRDEYFIPYLKEDDWDSGIRNGYDAIFSEIVVQNNLELDYNKPIEKEKENDLIACISMISAFVIAFFLKIKKSFKISVAYLLIGGIIAFCIAKPDSLFQTYLFYHLFIFSIVRFLSLSDFVSGGIFGSGSSSGHSSGGGGSFGGGGASGKF